MEEQDHQSPVIGITSGEVLISHGSKFKIKLGGKLAEIRTKCFIVIDIYDDTAPCHPDGHLGWWRFETSNFTTKEFDLTIDIIDLIWPVIESVQLQPSDFWFNPEFIQQGRVKVIAVLRSLNNNNILWQDTVLGGFDSKTLTAAISKTSFSRLWSEPQYSCLEKSKAFIRNRSVHIYAPNIFVRDAVGNFCLEIFRLLKQNNVDVHLYADSFDIEMRDVIKPTWFLTHDIEKVAGDSLLYFYSTYDPNLDALMAQPFSKRFLYFHGITEPKFFDKYDQELASACRMAIQQMAELSQFDYYAANSQDNVEKLKTRTPTIKTKIVDATIIPPKLLENNFQTRAIRQHKLLVSQSINLLYVGRLKAHKKIEDLLYLAKQLIERRLPIKLNIVGVGNESYQSFLKKMQKELELSDSEVIWHYSVTDSDLDTLYQDAAFYISMSEDEGFCLPVFEAMTAGVAVFAYDLPAVREMTAGTVVLFKQKDFQVLAEQIAILASFDAAYNDLIQRQLMQANNLVKKMNGQLIWEFISQTDDNKNSQDHDS